MKRIQLPVLGYRSLHTTHSRKTAAFAVCTLLALLQPVYADDGTWNTTTSGSLWSAVASWNGSTIADGSGFTADFNSLNPTADTTVNLDGARTIGNLIFGDTTTSTAASWILANNATPANILTLSVSSGTPTVTVNALGTGKSANISAVIDGTQGLKKNGSGTLVLSGGNTFSGGLTIDAGTVTTSNATGAGASTSDITLNGGNLNMTTAVGNAVNVTANSSLTLGNNTFWTGALKGNSGTTLTINVGATASPQGDWSAVSGTLLFTGANTLRPNISGGTTFGSANAIWDFGSSTITVSPRHSAAGGSDITFKMGALKSTGTGMTLTSNSNLTGGRVIYEVGALNQNTTYNGTISENAAHKVILSKVGTGTLTLGNTTTFTGGATVSAGTLKLGVANALAAGNAITLGGGTLDLGGFNHSSFTNGLTLTASSTLDFGSHIGAVTLTFADSHLITWTGTLNLLNFTVGTDTLSFTSITGLTVDQIAQISLAGYTATGLDSNGNVQFSAVPEPSTYAVLAGFTTLLVAAVRRRRSS